MEDLLHLGMKMVGCTSSTMIRVACFILYLVHKPFFANMLQLIPCRSCQTSSCGCLFTRREATRCGRRLQDYRTLRCFLRRASGTLSRSRSMDILPWLEWHGRVLVEWVRWIPSLKDYAINLILWARAFDGKAKVWSVDGRNCVATHSETNKTLWTVKWLPRVRRNEGFATAGANRSISFYREASGAWGVPRTSWSRG